MRAAARTRASGTNLCCSSGSDGASAGQPCRLLLARVGPAAVPARIIMHTMMDDLPCQWLLPSLPRPPPPSPPGRPPPSQGHLQGSPTASGPVSCTSRCRRRACGRWHGRSLERRLILVSACGHSLAPLVDREAGNSTAARKEESPAG